MPLTWPWLRMSLIHLWVCLNYSFIHHTIQVRSGCVVHVFLSRLLWPNLSMCWLNLTWRATVVWKWSFLQKHLYILTSHSHENMQNLETRSMNIGWSHVWIMENTHTGRTDHIGKVVKVDSEKDVSLWTPDTVVDLIFHEVGIYYWWHLSKTVQDAWTFRENTHNRDSYFSFFKAGNLFRQCGIFLRKRVKTPVTRRSSQWFSFLLNKCVIVCDH